MDRFAKGRIDQMNPSWSERLRYKIDNVFSKGTQVIILWFLLGSFLIVMFFALLLTLLNISPPEQSGYTFFEALWVSLVHTLDASSLGEDDGWAYRLFMLLITLGGVFVISALIGLITTGFENRLDLFQRGHSKVIEKGHTVVLGWGEHVFTIIEEICTANENQEDGCIVIMGDEDKIIMEEKIREKVPETGVTRIVCRRGSPIDPTSLDKLMLGSAKSIIVLSPISQDPDSEVIKICLAIIHHTKRTDKPFHIVAEMRKEKNMDIAKIIGGDEVEWVLSEDIISKMFAQTCRQSGLSKIYADLMDYAGDEIYFCSRPGFVGKTFGELLNLFETNALMGIWRKGFDPELNPSMMTVYEEGDQLFLLAEDDDQIFVQDFDQNMINEALIHDGFESVVEAEKMLLLGWNPRAPKILLEMDNYLFPNSSMLVVANNDYVKGEETWGNIHIQNAKIEFQFGDTSDRDILESLDPETFDHIILLSYSESLPYQAADAKTLITLFHLRDIANKSTECRFSIATEMLDIRNRNLAEVTEVDDFIVSNRFISLLLSQVSESKLLNGVFKDILNAKGSEVYLKSARNYIKPGNDVNFYTVVESARRKNEVAIGYRIVSEALDPDRAFGIVLNPCKSDMISFEPEDQIIVLSETF